MSIVNIVLFYVLISLTKLVHAVGRSSLRLLEEIIIRSSKHSKEFGRIINSMPFDLDLITI